MYAFAIHAAKADRHPAVIQVGAGVAGERERGSRLSIRGRMQAEAGIATRTLVIMPRQIEIFRGHPPERCGIACAEVRDRAPYVRRRVAIIHKERVGARTSNQEVGAGATVDHIRSSMRCDRIGAGAAMKGPVISAHPDIDVVGPGVDVLLLKATHRASVALGDGCNRLVGAGVHHGEAWR